MCIVAVSISMYMDSHFWNHPWVLKLDEARKRAPKENQELDMVLKTKDLVVA